VSASPAATERLARALGRVLQEGDLVLLSGELGSGKTRFVKGLAAGFGAARARDVVSPTFLRMEQYGAPPRLLRHVDAYRMRSGADLDALGISDLLGPGGATVVEWPERVAGALPPDALRVAFEHRGPRTRRITVTARGPRGRRLLEALRKARRPARARARS
jgi:tRNA threonylcarbamoyladenosine biosynthesis protein TsaE